MERQKLAGHHNTIRLLKIGFKAFWVHHREELTKCITKYIAEQQSTLRGTSTGATKHERTKDSAVGINSNEHQCEVAPSFLKWKKELQHTEIMFLMKAFATWKLTIQ